MWKQVLPLTLLFCTSILPAQTRSGAVESRQPVMQPATAQVVANDVAPPVTWEDPHAKLQRAVIVNAIMERQVALRRDTEKLLLLAEELKQNVDRNGPNILSMDVIKKAQEIEKLAKSVKDKMKQAY